MQDLTPSVCDTFCAPLRQLAEKMGKVIAYQGRIEFDPTKPDGAPRKLMNVSRLESLGFKATVGLEEGLTKAHEDYLNR